MPTLNEKKLFNCQAFLDSGDVADIYYESTYVSERTYINKIISCKYKGVEVAPLFGNHTLFAEDFPQGIYLAVENNAHFQWEQKDQIFKALGLHNYIN